MKNVAERLRALYSAESALDVRNGETGGVIAEIRVPFVEAEPGSNAERQPWIESARSSWTTSHSPAEG